MNKILTILALLCFAFLSQGVPAETRISGNAGTQCKAASGPGASVFYFSNLHAQNISNSGQYLTCSFGMIETSADFSYYNITNPSGTAGTSTCVLQTGHEGSTINSTVSTVQLGAYGAAYAFFIPMPVRSDNESTYTMSCHIPPQWKLGVMVLGRNI